jgi:UDP-glucose 4-epimerase
MSNKHKVVVTGVAGFIGSNLAERLIAAGHEVIGIDNLAYGREAEIPKGVDFRKIDIRSDEMYSVFEGVDTVFHLAAKNDLLACQRDPVETMDINVHGTTKVFEAARRAGVKKVVFASSSALEEGEARLKGFYAISKATCEKIADGYHAAYGLSYVLPRYFNVYGPRQDYRRNPPPVMTSFMIKVLKGEQPTIYEGVEGTKQDFIYVDDINDFHLQCLDDDRVNNRLFRLGTGKNVYVGEIWESIRKAANSDLQPKLIKPPAGFTPASTLADTTDALSVGWHAKTVLDDGIRAQFEYVKQQFAKGNIK